jgi:hypothetical protein
MKIFIALAVALYASTAWAQQTNPENVRQTNWAITCASTEYVIDFLKEYEERPVLTGKLGRAGKMAMLINTETGTWTLLGYTERGACIMASGEDVQQLDRPARNLR